jgi:hypothetical protein
MRLTKIDVAEAHLKTAVRCYFGGEHPASVYLLAGSAREILTSIGHRTGVITTLHGIAETTGQKLRKLIDEAHEHVNFLKHADRDPSAVLADFDEKQVQIVLFIACHDFHRIARGLPVELQVYEAWWFATSHRAVSKASLRAQPIIRRCIAKFPGIRRTDLDTQKQLGLLALEVARNDPSLTMAIHREVELPAEAPPSSQHKAKGKRRPSK